MTTISAPSVSVDLREAARHLRSLGYSPVPVCRPGHGCKSPGKGVHIRGWSQYSTQAPSNGEMEDWFRPTEALDRGNLGAALGPEDFVLDVDPRNGGCESLKLLEALHGLFIDCPVQQTGGGGTHYFFKLPRGTTLKAGHTLTPEYPGMEYKSGRGMVVVAPSTHASGNAYEWMFEQEIGAVPAPQIPEWLLGLALEADHVTHRAGDGERPPGSRRGQRTPEEAVRRFFRSRYTEGERTHVTMKALGYLRSRHVSEELAMRFIPWWQGVQFHPPQDSVEIHNRVVDTYRRYGRPNPEQSSRAYAWLVELAKHIQEYASASEEKETGPAHGPDDGWSKERSGSRTDEVPEVGTLQRLAGDEGQLVSLRRTGTKSEKNAEFAYCMNGGKLGIFEEADGVIPVVLERQALPKVAHLPKNNQYGAWKGEGLVEMIEGDPDFAYRFRHILERLQSCGNRMEGHCNQHGVQKVAHSTCRMPFHQACGSDTVDRLAACYLPYCEDTQSYHFARIYVRIDAPYPGGWSQAIEDLSKKWSAEVSALNKRKRAAGRLLARGVKWMITDTYLEALFSVAFWEEEADDMLWALDLLAQRMGGRLFKRFRFNNPDDIVMKLMEEASFNLLCIQGERAIEHFQAYWWATRHVKSFQSYGFLLQADEVEKDRLRETPDLEPRCEVSLGDGTLCLAHLHWVMFDGPEEPPRPIETRHDIRRRKGLPIEPPLYKPRKRAP